MKFREEVFAKIFTYITVIILLGIIVFEALSLQGERNALKQEQERVSSIRKNLDTMVAANTRLKEENRELQIFQNTWLAYAAFVEESEVTSLKTDLFTRPDLIPDEAVKEALLGILQKEEAENLQDDVDGVEGEKEGEETKDSGEAGGKKPAKKEPEEASAKEEERTLEYQFDNPDGEDVFFPLSIDAANMQNCLVYTVAFEKENGLEMELVYELTFENGNRAVRDENGEIVWKCIAYNAGNGFKGVRIEEDADD